MDIYQTKTSQGGEKCGLTWFLFADGWERAGTMKWKEEDGGREEAKGKNGERPHHRRTICARPSHHNHHHHHEGRGAAKDLRQCRSQYEDRARIYQDCLSLFRQGGHAVSPINLPSPASHSSTQSMSCYKYTYITQRPSFYFCFGVMKTCSRLSLMLPSPSLAKFILAAQGFPKFSPPLSGQNETSPWIITPSAGPEPQRSPVGEAKMAMGVWSRLGTPTQAWARNPSMAACVVNVPRGTTQAAPSVRNWAEYILCASALSARDWRGEIVSL